MVFFMGNPIQMDDLGVFPYPPETNISPENKPLQKEIPIGNHPFLGAKMLVSGSVFLETPICG